MSENAKNNLKLIGKNQEDLKVISAHFQDSIVAVKDMVFLEHNKIFWCFSGFIMIECICLRNSCSVLSRSNNE